MEDDRCGCEVEEGTGVSYSTDNGRRMGEELEAHPHGPQMEFVNSSEAYMPSHSCNATGQPRGGL